jgi:ferrous iron transport protein A
MPVSIAPLNVVMRVTKIAADEKVKKHLESLGITIGSNITVLQASAGNVILIVKDGRLALDKTLANKIFVA